MDVIDLSLAGIAAALCLLIIPVVISLWLGLRIIKTLLSVALRMIFQLVLIGIFLKYLFVLNDPWVNIVWLLIMIIVAVFSAINNSALNARKILLPTFCAFTVTTVCIVLYLNSVVIRLDALFDARYLVVLGGMLLGNSLRGTIVGIGSFYKDIRKDTKEFFYILSLGATRFEAILPYVQRSLRFALQPTFAAMATMGIVALPGMMTGSILGGVDPALAIKYQIMIMCAIVTATMVSVTLTILWTMKIGFTEWGTLNTDVFNKG